MQVEKPYMKHELEKDQGKRVET